MAEDIKVSAVEAEEPKSMAEKEETVLENAGISTKEDGMYKLDLNKINEQNQQDNAVQEQSADEIPVRDESGTSEEVVEEVQAETEKPAGESDANVQETPVL